MTTLAYRERRPGRRFLRGLLFVAAGLWMTGLIPAPADAAPEDVLDHYLFYKGKRLTEYRYPSFAPIRLEDPSLGWVADYKVVKGRRLGLPAIKNFERIIPLDPDTHLKEYAIVQVGGPKFSGEFVSVHNQCGLEWQLGVIKPVSLLVPSSKGSGGYLPPPDPGSHNVDHFLCYKVKLLTPDPVTGRPLSLRRYKPQVQIGEQFADKRYDLKKVFRLCNPVNKSEVPGDPPIWKKDPLKGLPVNIEPATIKNPELRLLGFKVRVAQTVVPQEPIPPIPGQTPSCRCQGECGSTSDPQEKKLEPRVEVWVNNQFGEEQGVHTEMFKPLEFYIPSSPSGAFLDAGTALLD